MAVYYPAGCELTLVDPHYCDPCEAKEKGRISSVAFIKNTFTFTDISNPTEWQTGINAGDIIIIPQVIGTFDGGAEVESSGYGRQSTSLTGYNFTSNYRDPNYKLNAPFYNQLKSVRNYKYAFVTETQIHLTDNEVQVIPKNPITDDLNSDVVWDVTVKWAGSDLPEPADVPPTIFDECFVVTA